MRHFLGLTIAVGLTWTAVSAGDWPRFRGAHFDGVSTEKNWLGTWPGGQPRQLWKKNVGTGFSSVAVADGRLFTLGNNGKQDRIYCIDAASGTEVWVHAYPEELEPKYYEGGPSATPTVDGDRVFTVSKAGKVLSLEAATGKVLWERNVAKDLGLSSPDWGFAGSPHVDGDLLILNLGLHGVAVKKATGETVWQSGKEAAGYGTPVPFTSVGKTALAIFGAKEVWAVDPQTGQALWHFPWKTSYEVNSADPVVVGDQMFVSSGYGTGGGVIGFGGGTPKLTWSNKEVRSHFSSAVAVDGYLYAVDGQGGDKDSKLKCVELATGKVRWTSPASETGNLTAADGKLIWITGRGELVIVEAKPDKYTELARAQVTGGKCWTVPVLANGRVYVRNAAGSIVCVDVKGNGPVI